MNYLQRREEEQNEADQEHGAQGAHGMCAPPAGDSRESCHGDNLPDSKCPFLCDRMGGQQRTGPPVRDAATALLVCPWAKGRWAGEMRHSKVIEKRTMVKEKEIITNAYECMKLLHEFCVVVGVGGISYYR